MKRVPYSVDAGFVMFETADDKEIGTKRFTNSDNRKSHLLMVFMTVKALTDNCVVWTPDCWIYSRLTIICVQQRLIK